MHNLKSLESELNSIRSWEESYRQIPRHSKLDEIANRLRLERKKDILRWMESLRLELPRPISVIPTPGSKGWHT